MQELPIQAQQAQQAQQLAQAQQAVQAQQLLQQAKQLNYQQPSTPTSTEAGMGISGYIAIFVVLCVIGVIIALPFIFSKGSEEQTPNPVTEKARKLKTTLTTIYFIVAAVPFVIFIIFGFLFGFGKIKLGMIQKLSFTGVFIMVFSIIIISLFIFNDSILVLFSGTEARDEKDNETETQKKIRTDEVGCVESYKKRATLILLIFIPAIIVGFVVIGIWLLLRYGYGYSKMGKVGIFVAVLIFIVLLTITIVSVMLSKEKPPTCLGQI